MRILFVLPHYFDAKGGGGLGSLRPDPGARARALAASVLSLRRLYSPAVVLLEQTNWGPDRFPAAVPTSVDIVVVTTRNKTALSRLEIDRSLFEHLPTDAEPRYLGFEAQRLFAEHAGQYDFYCYLEDDICVEDPNLFQKLSWFSSLAGPDHILQPHRYEASDRGHPLKVYIDGALPPGMLDGLPCYQPEGGWREIHGQYLGRTVRFVRATNPHSGCYFLGSEQLARWMSMPHWLDRDASFVSPLESAATLGLLKTFCVMKPAEPDASFAEVRHPGTWYMRRINTDAAPETFGARIGRLRDGLKRQLDRLSARPSAAPSATSPPR